MRPGRTAIVFARSYRRPAAHQEVFMDTSRTRGKLGLVSVFAILATTVACSENKPPATSAATSTTTAPATSARKAVGSNLTVSGEIYQLCHLDVSSETAAAPKFAFDQSLLTPSDVHVLEKIATCLTTGPLAGRSVMLVGRADPRGTEEYNLSLGARRAHSVGKYLEQLGVSTGHVDETSRGALDATGSDEAAWAVDRRVDISLMK
jgi:peptidoglycan-associated lipoprotein